MSRFVPLPTISKSASTVSESMVERPELWRSFLLSAFISLSSACTG